MAKVNLKYNPDLIFPWRVVHDGTDECVQVYGESMAYYTESEAMRGIREEGHELVDIKKGGDGGDGREK
jgi:hypothetical protein